MGNLTNRHAPIPAVQEPPRPVSVAKWQDYQRMASELGFAKMTAAPVHRVTCEDQVRAWVREGMHAEMHWFANAIEKRINPTLIMEDARSIAMLMTPYEPAACRLGEFHLARYAAGDDYHDVLIKPLRQLGDAMVADHPGGQYRAYVDTGPILERYWAQQAGLGWIGKNGCLLSREQGSTFFLAAIVTNLELPYGQRQENHCGNCRACIDECPTEAIVAEGVVDSRRCISYLNIEHRGPFESETPDFHNWVFGCDICQEVCPWERKFSQPPKLETFRPRPQYQTIDSSQIEAMPREDFSTIFRKSPLKRTKLAGLKRNAVKCRAEDKKNQS